MRQYSGVTNGIEMRQYSGVTNGIEMRHICQALQMDLKCLTYMSGVTNGIEMPDIYVRHYNWI